MALNFTLPSFVFLTLLKITYHVFHLDPTLPKILILIQILVSPAKIISFTNTMHQEILFRICLSSSSITSAKK